MEETEVQKIFFTNIEFKRIAWMEEGKEFEHLGKLYDVSKIEQTKNGFLVLCENDNWEEDFIFLFSSWKNHKSGDGKIKFLFQPMCFSEQTSIASTGFLVDVKFGNTHLQCSLSHPLRFFTPPRN